MVLRTEITNPLKPYESRVTTVTEPGRRLGDYLGQHDEVIVVYEGKIVEDYEVVVQDDTQIIISPVLQGGGGGTKDILRAIAFAALLIVAPYAAGAIIGAAGGALAGATAFYAVQAAVVIGGGLLINSVLSPQLPNFSGGTDSIETSPTYGWAGSRTMAAPGSPIPILYGQMRLAGNVIEQYTSVYDNEETLYMLLALCEGEIEPVHMDDVILNGNPLSNYKDSYYSWRAGDLAQIAHMNYDPNLTQVAWNDMRFIRWFGGTHVPNQFSTELASGSPVTYQTISNDVWYLTLRIVFPKGLFYIDDKGNTKSKSVEFKVEYRKVGETSWRVYQRIIPAHTVIEYEWVYGWDYWGDYTTKWSATSPGDGWAKSGRTRNIYKETQVYDTWWYSAAKTGTLRYEFQMENLDKDEGGHQYEVRVTKISGDETSNRASNEMWWGGMTERTPYYNYYPGIALCGFSLKATGQLSGSQPNFSILVRRKAIKIYDADGNLLTTGRSDNPAWVFFDLLTNRKYGAGLSPERIDMDRLFEWARWCDEEVPDGFGGIEPRARFNGVFDTSSNLWETLQKVCSVGRAAPAIQGTKYTMIIDKPADPVQLFTMGNIVKGSYKTAYIGTQDIATTVDVSFVNQNLNYAMDTVTVELKELTDTKRPQRTSLTSVGTTDQSQAFRLGRYMLWCNDKQRRVVEFDVGIDAIACNIGDVILFAHDVPAWGQSGRFVSVEHPRHLTIDRKVTFNTNFIYKVSFRLSETDTLVERNIVMPSDVGELWETDTFEVTEDLPTGTAAFDVYTLGEVDKEYIHLRVVNITRKDDLTRHIVAVDYNESILTDDDVPTAIERPSSITGFPHVVNVEIGERLIRRSDGTIVPLIDMSWEFENDRSAYTSIFWTLDGGHYTKLVDSLKETEFSFDASGFEEGNEYTFMFKTGDLTGTQSKDDATFVPFSYLGKSAPPENVQNLRYEISTQGIEFRWDENSDVDLSGYDLYIDDTLVNENFQSVHYTATDLSVGSHIFKVYAVDTSGNRSLEPNSINFDIAAPQIFNTRAEVVDNNVLLRWDLAEGTMPITKTVISKGGVVYGEKKGTFTTIFEGKGGTFTYCLKPVDIFGNEGNSECVTVEVSDPNDYVLLSDIYSDFNGTKSNALARDGKLYVPINVTESYEDHFVDNGWSSPQDQIDAGYPIMIEPVPTEGYYEEQFDYGTLIYNSKITVRLEDVTYTGTFTLTKECTISLSEDGSTWTDYSGWSVYGNNFRYVKVHVRYTGDQTTISETRTLRIILDLKAISDSETVDCSAADSNGTWVDFKVSFYDVDSIFLTPLSTDGSPVTAVYDFDDVPNPTGFSIYLYDKDGNRIDGKCSWIAKGY